MTYSGKTPPKAINGVLDFKNWNFREDGPINLDGEWKFKWMETNPRFALQDFDDTTWDNFDVPAYWNKKTGKQFGYCWLRLKIKNISQESLGLYLNSSHTSYQIYVDDVLLLKNGEPGTIRSNTTPQYLPIIESLPDKNGLTIAWHISNFHDVYGGPNHGLRIGNIDAIRGERWKTDIKDTFILGIILMMVLYHLFVWIGRIEDKSNLYFALFCLVIFIRTLVDYNYITRIFPSLNLFAIQVKLNMLSLPFGWTLFAAFLYTLFPKEFTKTGFKIILLSSIIISCFIIVTPRWIYSILIIFYQLLLLSICIWFIVTILRALKNKKSGSGFILFGFIFILLAVINDIISTNMPSYNLGLIQISVVIFIFAQSTVLSNLFAKAFRTAEHLSSNLKKEVKRQTRDLAEKNKEIQLANDKLKEMDYQKTLFYQNITHEFRTPLTLLLGPLETISNDKSIEQNPFLKNKVQMMVRNAGHLLHLINQLLDVSMLEAGKARLNYTLSIITI